MKNIAILSISFYYDRRWNSLIKTDDLIAEAVSLPVEIRTQLVDKLLQSLNPTRKEIDEAWAEEAEKRVEEIRTGKVKTILGEEVFKKIRNRLST